MEYNYKFVSLSSCHNMHTDRSLGGHVIAVLCNKAMKLIPSLVASYLKKKEG